MIKATCISDIVASNTQKAHALSEKSKIGQRTGQKILYTAVETLYLIESKKMVVEDAKGNLLTHTDLLKKFMRKDKHISEKYKVFKDLTKKGYLVKTGLKFGSDFRVYEKKKKDAHAKWLVHVTTQGERSKWSDLASRCRVAHSTKKKILIAIIDEESDISYFEASWKRP